MSDKVLPSKFHFVDKSTPIKQCLLMMKEKDLSFLLVYDEGQQLEGIFTLKDILRTYQYLAFADHVQKPISVVMTKPVETLPSHKLHQAVQIMLEKNIRHLPVVSEDDDSGEQIVGVIDAESLLRAQQEKSRKDAYESKDLSVFSPNGSLLKFMQDALDKYQRIQVDKLWASKLKTPDHFLSHIQNYDLFFLDVIDRKSLHFAHKFSDELEKTNKSMIVLVDNGLFKQGEEEQQLKNLARLSHVRVYEKPVNVHDLIFECLY